MPRTSGPNRVHLDQVHALVECEHPLPELLGPGATVVVEGSRRHPLPAVVGARVVDERRYGDTVVTWLARAESGGGG